MEYQNKINAIFDKDNYTEAEFTAMINFLVVNESIDNIFWLYKPKPTFSRIQPLPVPVPFITVSIEQGFFTDDVIGLSIVSPKE